MYLNHFFEVPPIKILPWEVKKVKALMCINVQEMPLSSGYEVSLENKHMDREQFNVNIACNKK